jgi:DNA polymerase I-like protein with 3'-5' exonuclease and polymerase domains
MAKPKKRTYPRGRKIADCPGQTSISLVDTASHPSLLVRQTPLYALESNWLPTPVASLPSWAGAKRIAIDIETDDPELKTLGIGVRRTGRIIGISFAIEDGPSHYMPFWHVADNLDPHHVLDYLRLQSETFTGDLVGANLSYDLDYLWEQKIMFPRVRRHLDVQVAEPLIDDLQDSYSLDNIARRHGIPGKDEHLLRSAAASYHVDAKSEMKMIPARFVGVYAEQDVRLPLILMRRQERMIEEQEVGKVFDLETRLLPALLRMRRRGVRVDERRLEEVSEWAQKNRREAVAAVNSQSKVKLAVTDMSKSAALAEILADVGIKTPLTDAGNPSVDAEFLASLDHPLGRMLTVAKRYHKLLDFVGTVRKHLVRGRIHATFNQLRRSVDGDTGEDDQGARYGRISCTDPNLQNQPSRDSAYEKKEEAGTLLPDDKHLGYYWRSIYIPEDGELWASCDYSSQEPRLAAHFAESAGCAGGAEIAQAYRDDPDLDLHAKTAELAGIPRKKAKILFLAKLYSMGDVKTANDLKLPTIWVGPDDYLENQTDLLRWKRKLAARQGCKQECAGEAAQETINKFNELVPFARELAKLCSTWAERRGWVSTILGRKCRFPRYEGGQGQFPRKFDNIRKALNRVIQGSAGDQTKMSLVLADEAGIPLLLQVHDELDLSIPNKHGADGLAEIMRNAVKLNVPTKVDVEIGASWGESMK